LPVRIITIIMGGISAIAVLIMTGIGLAGGVMMMMTTLIIVEAGTAGGAIMMITTVPGIPRRFTLASRGGIACKAVKSRGEVTAPLPRR